MLSNCLILENALYEQEMSTQKHYDSITYANFLRQADTVPPWLSEVLRTRKLPLLTDMCEKCLMNKRECGLG